jgi:hypothetical protein
MAVADQHHKNVQTLHSNEQIKQMTHLLVGVLHCHPASGLGGPMACHSNRAFAAARNHIATNMGLFIVNLRPKWRNNKAI